MRAVIESFLGNETLLFLRSVYIVCSSAYDSYDKRVNLISSLHSLDFSPFIAVTVQWTGVSLYVEWTGEMNEHETDLPQQDAADEFHSSTLEEDHRLMEPNAIEQKSPCRSTRLPAISSDNLVIDDIVAIFSLVVYQYFLFETCCVIKNAFLPRIFSNRTCRGHRLGWNQSDLLLWTEIQHQH